MSRRASVVGTGIASLTCARLLQSHGWEVKLRPVARPGPPVLLLNEVTLSLLDDVWGPGLVDDGHPLRERRVRWGEGATEAVVPTTSMAVERDGLHRRLWERVGFGDGRLAGPADWVVDGAGHDKGGPSPPVASRSFGRRWLVQAEATPLGATWATDVETVADGWVHLAPMSPDRAVVQCMVPVAPADAASTLADMVGATTAIRRRVGAWSSPVTAFPAAPRLSSPMVGDGWVLVGDAAAAADPVSGFGTAWAVRGGILAAAVLEAVAGGRPEPDCLRHYQDRLARAVQDHVEQCLRLYRAAFRTPAWDDELRRMARELAAARGSQGTPHDGFRFRLDGVRLEPVRSSSDSA